MKKLTLISLGFLFIFSLAFGATAMADDDEYEGYEIEGYNEGEHGDEESLDSYEEEDEEYEDDEEDDDDEYEYRGNNQITEYNQYRQEEQTGYWNIWTREVVNTSATVLPVTVSSEITLKINDQQTKIYAVPQNGQLLISAEDLAKKLDADVKVFTESNIVKVTKGENELIVRAGSNVAYENRIKTPMPVEAEFYEKSVYIPICVLTNALGYRIDWVENEKRIYIVNV